MINSASMRISYSALLTRGNGITTLSCFLVIDDKHSKKHHYIKVKWLRADTHTHITVG